MADRQRGETSPTEPAVSNRWWVDVGGSEKEKPKRPPGPVGARLFKAAEGFEQERAREQLTDNNLKVISEANPAPGEWVHVQLGDKTFPRRELERIKKTLALPGYARGVIVDCGLLLRLLVTGTPPGARLLELALGEVPSFDCWIEEEWVREELFDDADKALAGMRRFIKQYLAPDSIALYDSIAPRA